MGRAQFGHAESEGSWEHWGEQNCMVKDGEREPSSLGCP